MALDVACHRELNGLHRIGFIVNREARATQPFGDHSGHAIAMHHAIARRHGADVGHRPSRPADRGDNIGGIHAGGATIPAWFAYSNTQACVSRIRTRR